MYDFLWQLFAWAGAALVFLRAIQAALMALLPLVARTSSLKDDAWLARAIEVIQGLVDEVTWFVTLDFFKKKD